MSLESSCVNLTSKLLEKARQKINFAAKEGCTKNGVLEIDTSIKPDWYNESRFKKAQKIVQEYYVSAQIAGLIGLLLLLQFPIILVPLMATGRSKNSKELFKRYFNTVQYVDEWFHSDPFDTNSNAYKTLSMTKSMHLEANQMMNKKIKPFDFAKKILKEKNPKIKEEEVDKYIHNKNRVWVSQYDMVLTQFAFVGCLILEPKACGIHEANAKEIIKEIVYLWKVLSFRLGIDSKYSLFEEDDFDLVYSMCKIILINEYLVNMQNVAAPAGIRMSECIISILNEIFISANCFTANCLLKSWYKVFNANSHKLNREGYENNNLDLSKMSAFLNDKNQLSNDEKRQMIENNYNDKYTVKDPSLPFEKLKLNGIKEKFFYKLYLALTNGVLKYKMSRDFAKNFIRRKIFETRKNKAKILKKFNEKNNNERFQFPECPFTGKIETNEYLDFYQKSR